jgi:hypothetical protein
MIAAVHPTPFNPTQQALVFVFDVTSRASFDALNGWYSDAVRLTLDKRAADASAAPKLRGVVVANKVDAAARVVPQSDGKEWASAHDLAYFECSAKSGSNVKEMFDFLVRITSSVALAHSFPLVLIARPSIPCS